MIFELLREIQVLVIVLLQRILVEEVNAHVVAGGVEGDLIRISQVHDVKMVVLDRKLIAEHGNFIKLLAVLTLL